jgi:hypothetical protein
MAFAAPGILAGGAGQDRLDAHSCPGQQHPERLGQGDGVRPRRRVGRFSRPYRHGAHRDTRDQRPPGHGQLRQERLDDLPPDAAAIDEDVEGGNARGGLADRVRARQVQREGGHALIRVMPGACVTT